MAKANGTIGAPVVCIPTLFPEMVVVVAAWTLDAVDWVLLVLLVGSLLGLDVLIARRL